MNTGYRLGSLAVLCVALLVLASGARAEQCALQAAGVVGEWSGRCPSGVAQGEGRAQGADWVYEGEAENGKAHGQGSILLDDGSRYEGEWRNGARTGHGLGVGSDGSRHEGQFRHGKAHGWGTGTSPGGGTFTGEWRDGRPHGEGVETAGGERREVEYRDGVLVEAEPCEVEFEGGLFDWSGPCIEGLATGEGTASGPNWSYKGEAKNGKADGKGTLTLDGGGWYEGEFRDGERTGHGVSMDSQGDRHEGQFRDGKAHGWGTGTSPGGGTFTGEFRDGVPHGEGTETAGGESREVEYRDGVLVERGPETCKLDYEGDLLDWTGPCDGALATGTGRAEGDGGAFYEGSAQAGKPHGEGTADDGEGTRYQGSWREGVGHGYGTFTRASDDYYYQGEFQDGVAHGRGTEIKDGERYIGEFRNGERVAVSLDSSERRRIQEALATAGFDPGPADGQFGPRTRRAIEGWQQANGYAATGKLTRDQIETLLTQMPPPVALQPKCAELPGQYLGGNDVECWDTIEGRSGCYWWNTHHHSDRTTRWSGRCDGGLADGHGTLSISAGSEHLSYEGTGTLSGGKKNVRWTEAWADGRRYEGGIRDGERRGQGTYTWPNGVRYEGSWRDGMQHGYGTVTSPDGARYEGGFRDGKPHGHGTVTMADGVRYEGEWRDGCFDENGRRAWVFTTAAACGFE